MVQIVINTQDHNGGPHTFDVEVDTSIGPGGPRWTYTIWNPQRSECFQARFRTMKDGRIRLMAIDHNGVSALRGKGIPEALFGDLVKRSNGATLVSSLGEDPGPQSDDLPNDFDTYDERSEFATRMWDRLVSKGKAKKNSNEDRYTYLP